MEAYLDFLAAVLLTVTVIGVVVLVVAGSYVVYKFIKEEY